MDWLDRVSIALIVFVSIITLSMMVKEQRTQAKMISEGKKKVLPLVENKYKEVEDFIEKGTYDEALKRLGEIAEKDPEGAAKSKLYKARIFSKQGNMGKAIFLYRQTIETTPDLLEFASNDLNLWDLIEKGIPKMQREKRLKPNDEKVAKLLKDLYFLQRKLGQGCD